MIRNGASLCDLLMPLSCWGDIYCRMSVEYWTDGEKKYTFDEVMADVQSYDGDVFIGADSQQHSQRRVFTRVICLYNAEKRKGGRYYYQKIFLQESDFESLMTQLSEEAENALQLAMRIQEYNPSVKIEIHLDCSPAGSGHGSSRFADMLQGWVTSMGFDCKIKPDGWAACAVADRHSK
jgi:predicted RNase H-related nuclease YkuK (DUF458 family)